MVDPKVKQNLLQGVDSYEGLEGRTDKKVPADDWMILKAEYLNVKPLCLF